MTAEYPEHKKLKLVKERSQSIGEFLEWLQEEKKLTLCRLDEDDDFVPSYLSKEKLLAEFFEIDLNKLEDEKRAMLDALRKLTDEKRAMLDAIRKANKAG